MLTACGSNDCPPPAPPSPSLTIASISTTTPVPLTPLYLKMAGFDPAQPYTVTLANSAGSSVALRPLRTAGDGTVVLAVPLHLDANTGLTASLPCALTVTQGGVSASVNITIAELPSLASYGVPLGAISRAFYIHQSLAFGRSLNAQQALANYKTPPAVSNAGLIAALQTQLRAVILARNDIDRIVVDNSLSIPVGTALDGTDIAFNAGSVDLMDRMIAQYLLAYSNNGTLINPVSRSASAQKRALRSGLVLPTLAAPTVMQTIVQSMGIAKGSQAFLSMQQAQTAKAGDDPQTMDELLASVSNVLTIVTVGAAVIAVGAALVPGGAVIAAGAAALATYAALAGAAVGAVAVGSDLVNVGTNIYDYVTASEGSAAQATALSHIEKSTAALASDVVATVLAAEGIGGLTNAFSLGRAATSVMEGIFEPVAKDAFLATADLANTVAKDYAANAFDETNQSAAQTVGSLNGSADFGFVDGTATITNNQGPILAGLTGVSIGNGASAAGTFSTIADPGGDYTVVVPLDNPSIAYGSLVCSAFDPITEVWLASAPLDLTTLTAGSTVKGPTLSGQCNDSDASNPDSDDPDCD